MPGGSGSYATSGQYNTLGTVYGNARCLPLIGGSGGGGGVNSNGGGGGGGAILIAARGSIVFGGTVDANGGSSPSGLGGVGSGGAIRFVANTITTQGSSGLYARGTGSGFGNGRIRLEGNTRNLNGDLYPVASQGTVGTTALIWPENVDPICNISMLGSNSLPNDPFGGFSGPDLAITTSGPFDATVNCMNVPTDGSWAVYERATKRNGQAVNYPCTYQSGNLGASVWKTATFSFNEGLSTLVAHAYKL